MSTRKDNGAASVYFDHRSGMACQGARYYKGCIGRWLASISMGPDGSGKRVRARLAARTKTELLPRPEEARLAADSGLEISASHTVGQCLDDFLATGLESWRRRRSGTSGTSSNSSSRTVEITRNTLARPITLAQANFNRVWIGSV